MELIKSIIEGVKIAIWTAYQVGNSPFEAIGLPEWTLAAVGISLILGIIGIIVYKSRKL